MLCAAFVDLCFAQGFVHDYMVSVAPRALSEEGIFGWSGHTTEKAHR